MKNDAIKNQEKQLAEKEDALAKLQNNIYNQVQKLVSQRITKREESLKFELTKMMLKYEEAVSEFGKENKRLQGSLKEVVCRNSDLLL